MKQFWKENLYSVLFLLLLGFVLIVLGRLIVAECYSHATLENMEHLSGRIRCLSSFGWVVDETSETSERVYIPEKFDSVWSQYNEIQNMCGFDLSRYRGKSAVRYTYRALNFPGDTEAEVFVTILVFGNRMIGGDCKTVAIDGFLLPIDIRSVR